MVPIGVTMAFAAGDGGRPARVQVNAAYVRAVAEAGGLPVLLAPGAGTAVIEGWLEGIAGLVLTGGGDIDPARYGEAPHATVAGVSAERDALELAAVRGALARGLPVLAICRGMQLLNVALGGSLIQHVPEWFAGSNHQQEEARDAVTHDVRLTVGSLAAEVCGTAAFAVNSMHHQALGRMGEGLVVSGHALDGVIEACEMPGRPVLGVQWHPEELTARGEARRLFAWAVAEAGRRGDAPPPR
ncbi:MAG: gamma-glutamyl-gamma-aminobutyrate hydrolase family protein [Dehalococcoidia bacterium]|nr:gamma-glutamyl-gamma-aminobutyrate hydrolase family protein [Dehalococcoidia bacterium]